MSEYGSIFGVMGGGGEKALPGYEAALQRLHGNAKLLNVHLGPRLVGIRAGLQKF